MQQRHLNRSDRLISQLDSVLRTVTPKAVMARRDDPAMGKPETVLDELERRQVAALMRATHLATVGAQGLCHGQVGIVILPQARRQIDQAQQEAGDHLAWCQQRLAQLQSRTSYFTPLCYGAAFGTGAITAIVGDRFGLGTVAATKELIGRQLNKQLLQLPLEDQRSRALFRQMAADNTHHSQLAVEAGGMHFPAPVKWGIRALARGVLKGAYYA